MTDTRPTDELRLTIDDWGDDAVATADDDDEPGPSLDALEARRVLLLARLAALTERQIRAVRWPRWVYHRRDGARIVATPAAKGALGPGWQNRPLPPE